MAPGAFGQQPPTQQSYGQPPPPQAPPQQYGQQQSYGQPPPNPYGQQMPMTPGMVGGMGGYGFGQYEFNEMENGIIAKTAGRAKVWGIISIVVGALYLLSALFFIFSPALLMNLAPGIGGIIVGISFVGVGNSLNSVVQTQGNDVEHMMQATQKLSSAFMTQIIVTIVQAVLYVLLALLAFFVLAILIASGSGP
jgi:hypothetical protein